MSTAVLRGGGSTVTFGKMIRFGVAFGFGLGEIVADCVGLAEILGFGLGEIVADFVGLAEIEGLGDTDLPGFTEVVALAVGLGETLARFVRDGVGVALGLGETVGLGVALPFASAGLKPSAGISKASARHALICVRFITDYFQFREGKCQ